MVLEKGTNCLIRIGTHCFHQANCCAPGRVFRFSNGFTPRPSSVDDLLVFWLVIRQSDHRSILINFEIAVFSTTLVLSGRLPQCSKTTLVRAAMSESWFRRTGAASGTASSRGSANMLARDPEIERRQQGLPV